MSLSRSLPEPHSLSNTLDVLIIGGGPAGLAAALSLGRVLRSAAVFDSQQYRNEASNHVHTVPMHDHESPDSARKRMRDEIQTKYKTITFTGRESKTARKHDGIFEIVDDLGKLWKGRKLILAIGVEDILPDIPGFRDSWGKGIIHCLFCRGFEETREKISRAAVLVPQEISAQDTDNFLISSEMILHFTPHLTVLLNGNAVRPSHQKISAIAVSRGFHIYGKSIKRLAYVGPIGQMMVYYSDGSEEMFDFLFYSPHSQLRGDIASRLGLEMDTLGSIRVSGSLQETSVHGVFAAGDCVAEVKKVAIAIGQGVSAGVGANFQIVKEDIERGL